MRSDRKGPPESNAVRGEAVSIWGATRVPRLENLRLLLICHDNQDVGLFAWHEPIPLFC